MNSRTLWNDNWYFAKQHWMWNGKTGRSGSGRCSRPDLPHDWLIYDTKNLYEDSIGWYRKKFVYSTSGTSVANVSFCASRCLHGFFHLYKRRVLGDWKYGYSTFDWDITDHLREGENEVVLRVTFQAPNSRWYSGAGIYRNVWMICLPETHIPLDGIYTSSVETQKGYDLTIDTELKWGTDNGNYALEYCLYYTGDSKAPQKQQAGRFSG